jgi:hypothetical protein
MKTFLDLLAIDTSTLAVELRLSPVMLGQSPQCRVEINGMQLYDDHVCQDLELCHSTSLLLPLDVAVSLKGKVYSATNESAIVVKSLTVNGHNVLAFCSQHTVYTNDHGYHDPTTYLGFNGTWHFNTTKPFYHWWHDMQGRGWLLTPHAQIS